MKTIIAAIALAATTAMPAFAATMCVQQRDIVSTHSDDGKNMTFKMNDGRVLVNHLQGICTDLRYEGFAWNLRIPADLPGDSFGPELYPGQIRGGQGQARPSSRYQLRPGRRGGHVRR